MFKTPRALEKKVDEYFEQTKEENYTISGLCLHLRCNKDTFYEYGKRPGYKEVIDYARLMIEHSYELLLKQRGKAGDIFAMKNFGWTDKPVDRGVDEEDENDNRTGVILIPDVGPVEDPDDELEENEDESGT